MEKIVKDSVIENLAVNVPPITRRRGLYRSRSCATCWHDFLHPFICQTGCGFAFIAVYPEMSRAFGRVLHPYLVAESSFLGVSCPHLFWLTSYLSRGTKSVVVKGHIQLKIYSKRKDTDSPFRPLRFLMSVSIMRPTELLTGSCFSLLPT